MKHILYVPYFVIITALKRLLSNFINFCDRVLTADGPLLVAGERTRWLRLLTTLGDVAWYVRDWPRLSVYRFGRDGWRVIFVGSEESCRELREDLFGAADKPLAFKRVWLANLQRRVDEWLAGEADLVICEVSRIQAHRLKAPLAFTIPVWVTQVLALPEKADDLLAGSRHKSLRQRIQRCLKQPLDWHITRDPADFDFFYERMYRPFILARHGDTAMLTSAADLSGRWMTDERGGLLLITLEGKPVAGTTVYRMNQVALSSEGGLLDADPALWQMGLNTMIDWYFICWAQQQGMKWVDLGSNRPWCSDGAFGHKAEWGAQVSPSTYIQPNWRFLAHELPAGLRDCLNQKGLIAERGADCWRVVLGREATEPTHQPQLDGLAGIWRIDSQ